MVGLEAPAKGTLEPPVGSDLDGGGCPAALQGVSGPLNGGGEPVVDVVVFIPYTAVGPSSHCCWSCGRCCCCCCSCRRVAWIDEHWAVLGRTEVVAVAGCLAAFAA